ncbi:MAG: hypothetical protein QXT19_04370 [Candidatus Woesearchaeota archaeon]
MRLKYDISHLAGKGLRDYLMQTLKHIRKDIHIDKMLLFHHALFDGNELVTHNLPDGFQKKEGTIRYRQSLIRIPANIELPVYETEEFNAKKPPRGLVTIPTIVVCHFDELSMLELKLDGFKSHDEALECMRQYYPDLQKDSIVSFYYFGGYTPKPSKRTLDLVLKQISS